MTSSRRRAVFLLAILNLKRGRVSWKGRTILTR